MLSSSYSYRMEAVCHQQVLLEGEEVVTALEKSNSSQWWCYTVSTVTFSGPDLEATVMHTVLLLTLVGIQCAEEDQPGTV